MSLLNIVCPICTDPFVNSDDIYSTSCGHLYHLQCMRQWQSRLTSCPQCRHFNPTTHKIYLSFEESNETAKLPHAALENLSFEANCSNIKSDDTALLQAKYRTDLEKEITELKDKIRSYDIKERHQEQLIRTLNDKLAYFEENDTNVPDVVYTPKEFSEGATAEAELEELKYQIYASDSQEKQRERLMRRLNEQIVSFEKENAKQQQQITCMVKEMSHLKKRSPDTHVSELKEQILANDSKEREQENFIKILNDKIEFFEAINSKQSQKITSLSKEISNLKGESPNMHIVELKDKIQASINKQKQQEGLIARLQEEISSMENAFSKQTREMSILTNEISNSKKGPSHMEIAKLNSRVIDSIHREKEQDLLIRKLQEDFESLEQATSQRSQQIALMTVENSNLKGISAEMQILELKDKIRSSEAKQKQQQQHARTLQEEIASLQKTTKNQLLQIFSLSAEMNILKAGSSQKEIVALKEKIQQADNKEKQNTVTINQLEDEITTLESINAKKSQDITWLNKELSSLKGDSAKMQIEELRDKIGSSNQKQQQQEQHIKSLTDEIAALRKNVALQSQQMKSLSQEMADLRNGSSMQRIKMLESKIRSCDSQDKHQEQLIRQLQNEITELETISSMQSQQITLFTTEISNSNMLDITELEDKIQASNNKEKQQEQLIRNLKEQIASLERDNTKQFQQIAELAKNISTSKPGSSDIELAALRYKLHALSNKEMQRDKVINSLHEQMELLENINSKQSHQLSSLTKEINDLNGRSLEVIELRDRIAAAGSKEKQQLQFIRSLENEIESLEKINLKQAQQITTLTKTIYNLKSNCDMDIVHLEYQIEDSCSKEKQHEKFLASLEDDMAALEENKAKQSKQIEVLTIEMSSLMAPAESPNKNKI